MTRPTFEQIAVIHAEFRDCIADTMHAEFELRLPPAFGLVLIKSFASSIESVGALEARGL